MGMKTEPKIALLGSNYGQRPDPNIIALARHLTTHKDFKVVIVMARGSQNYWPADLQSTLKFVNRNSIASISMLLKANVVFYTHSLSDIFRYAHKLPFIKQAIDGKLVFLQHGIIALKKTLSNGKSLGDYIGSLEPTFDLMVVSSRAEAVRVSELGIPQHKLAITGLPRFDQYQTQAQNPKNRILVFFTWQDETQLKAKTRIVSDAIANLSDKPDIDFAHHPMMKSSAANFDISNYSLLITDDSSLAWDFFYLGKQVIFVRPGQWLIPKNDFVTQIANNPKELESCLALALHSPEHYKVDVRRFCDFFDQDNCARIVAAATQSNTVETGLNT